MSDEKDQEYYETHFYDRDRDEWIYVGHDPHYIFNVDTLRLEFDDDYDSNEEEEEKEESSQEYLDKLHRNYIVICLAAIHKEDIEHFAKYVEDQFERKWEYELVYSPIIYATKDNETYFDTTFTELVYTCNQYHRIIYYIDDRAVKPYNPVTGEGGGVRTDFLEELQSQLNDFVEKRYCKKVYGFDLSTIHAARYNIQKKFPLRALKEFIDPHIYDFVSTIYFN